MRIPPRGERYVAASWIALSVAVTSALAGTMAALAVRADLPERVAVRWDGYEPVQWSGLTAFLVVSSILTVGSCAALLTIGRVMHRSVSHNMAGPAAGTAVVLAVFAYAPVWAQSREPATAINPLGWGLAGCVAGVVVGAGLLAWSRPGWAGPAVTPPVPVLDVPTTARLAWSGRVGMAWWSRALLVALCAAPAGVVLWWVHAQPSSYIPLLGVVAGLIVSTRGHQLVVDYSGVGIRARYASSVPSAIPLGHIGSAESATVSVRDFGGWGYRKAPDGREGWIVRTGDALVVHRTNGRDVVFTVDNAAEAAAVVNTLVARYQSRDQTLTA